VTTGIIKLVKATLGDGPWTLEQLADRKFVEHDTSLSREDVITGANQNKPDPKVVEQLLALSKEGVISVDEVAQFRKLRMDKTVENYKLAGKELSFSSQDFGASYGEAGFLLKIFGNDGKISATHAKSFLLDERIPDDFSPHLPIAINQSALDPLVAKIRAATESIDPRAVTYADEATKREASAKTAVAV
ncbi:hypothetical protein HDU93_007001, partial [Gonapodya sp. JEL0774]